MKDFDISFLKQPLSIFAIVTALVIVLGGLGYYETILMPLQKEKTEASQRLIAANIELKKINSRIKEMDALEAQLNSQQEELVILRNMFPDEEVVTSRLRDLHRAFRASGIEVLTFKPIPKKVVKVSKKTKKGRLSNKELIAKAKKEANDPTQYYNTNLYSIELVGGYHMVGDMFAEIANFPYPTLISDLSAGTYNQIVAQLELQKTQGWTPYTMNLKFTLTTFTSRK